jgi:hypothetical protein
MDRPRNELLNYPILPQLSQNPLCVGMQSDNNVDDTRLFSCQKPFVGRLDIHPVHFPVQAVNKKIKIRERMWRLFKLLDFPVPEQVQQNLLKKPLATPANDRPNSFLRAFNSLQGADSFRAEKTLKMSHFPRLLPKKW